MRTFRLDSTWRLPAPRRRVWDALIDVETWPTWWPAMESVVVLQPGDKRGIGRRVRLRVNSGLGYRLTFTLRITEVTAPAGVLAVSTGHLVGTGRWTLTEVAGSAPGSQAGTQLRTEWEVALAQPWLRFLVPLAARFFVRRHDAVMAGGEQGLARLLRAPGPGAAPRPR